MLCEISGQVVELVYNGFQIRTDEEQIVKISTFADGWELDLKVGDQVEVLGGPGRRPDTFASSSIRKRVAAREDRGDPEWVEVKDGPHLQFRNLSPLSRIIRPIRRFFKNKK